MLQSINDDFSFKTILSNFLAIPENRKWWGNTESYKLPLNYPHNIYHYTNASALKNILLEKKLRLTKFDFMNDLSEIENAYENFIKCLQASSINDKEKIEEEFKKNKIHRYLNTYVLSLSTNQDSLPLWLYYGKNNGYNLKLDNIFIEDFASRKIVSDRKFIDGKWVDYNPHQSVDVITKNMHNKPTYKISGHLVNYDKKFQINIFKFFISEIEKNDDPKFIKLCLNFIANIIPFFKVKHFEHENEYRILVEIEEVEPPNDYINYRIYNGILIPYLEIGLSNPSYFKKICNSPMNSSEETYNSMDYFARNYRPPLEITHSKIPVRKGW